MTEKPIWFDPEIDRVDEVLLEQATPLATKQLGMDSILSQVEGGERVPEEKNEPLGCVPMTPSDFELGAKIANLPKKYDADPDRYLDIVSPSQSELIGSLRGVESHFTDSMIIAMLYEYRNFGKVTSPVSSYESLKTYERSAINNLVSSKLAKYPKLSITDLPELTNDIRLEWRESLDFSMKKKRERKSPNVPKSTGKVVTPYVEGDVWCADEVRYLWNDPTVSEFSLGILEAHQDLINTARTSTFSEESGILPFETTPGIGLSIEKDRRFVVALPYGSFVQFSLRTDYQITSGKGKSKKVMIVDTKFGSEEDSTVKRLQRFIYASAVKYQALPHRRRYQESGHPSYEELDPTDIGFYYRVLKTDPKTNIHTFEYEEAMIFPSEVEELRREFALWATDWWFNYKKYYELIKELKRAAVVYPHIPENPDMVNVYQKTFSGF